MARNANIRKSINKIINTSPVIDVTAIKSIVGDHSIKSITNDNCFSSVCRNDVAPGIVVVFTIPMIAVSLLVWLERNVTGIYILPGILLNAENYSRILCHTGTKRRQNDMTVSARSGLSCSAQSSPAPMSRGWTYKFHHLLITNNLHYVFLWPALPGFEPRPFGQ